MQLETCQTLSQQMKFLLEHNTLCHQQMYPLFPKTEKKTIRNVTRRMAEKELLHVTMGIYKGRTVQFFDLNTQEIAVEKKDNHWPVMMIKRQYHDGKTLNTVYTKYES